MFQGVRGSVMKANGPVDAKKLVMLNEAGVIDDSCLTEDLRSAGTLRHDLDEEIQIRGENDLRLDAAIEKLDKKVDQNKTNVDEEIAQLRNRAVEDEQEYRNGISANSESISGINGEISSINGQISTISGQISTISSNLSSVSSDLTNTKVDLQNLTSTVSSTAAEVQELSDTVTDNNRLLDKVTTQLAETSTTLLDLTTRLVTDEQAIKTLQEYVVARVNGLQAQISSLDERIGELENILKEKLEDSNA